MLDLRSFVWLARKFVMQGFYWCECRWKKTFEKEADRTVTLCICFRSAQSKFEATLTFTDTAKVKLFTGENQLSSKTAVSLDTPLAVITDFECHHLEYFIQDVGRDVFDQVSAGLSVSKIAGVRYIARLNRTRRAMFSGP